MGGSRPWAVVLAAVVLLALAPAFLKSSVGVERGSAIPAEFLHLLLEWTSASAALVVAILASARFLIRRDPVSLVVASVMFLSVPLESLHAVAAIGPAPTVERTVWTWTLARLFTALSLTAGIGLLGVGGELRQRGRLSVVLVWSLGVGAIVLSGAISGDRDLPQALHPDFWATRPWELAPFVLFAVGGLFVFPRLHSIQPTMLSRALVLGAVPHIACEFQVAFFSRALFDANFYGAHLQKILAYAIVFLGLVFDYIQAQRREEVATLDLVKTREKLSEETQQAQVARLELERELGERLRIEEAQLMLQKAVETASFGVTLTDLEGRIVYVNRGDAVMHGYRPQELLGKDARLYGRGTLPTPQEPPRIRFWDRESVNIRKDGTRFPVRLISDWVSNPGGEPIGLLTICEDISERREAERIKEDFLSTVSHELRTPLTSIVAALGLLESNRLRPAPERARELSAIAYRNSNRLLKLIDDLLDLQKLKAGRMGFHLEPLEVHSVLQSAIGEIRSFAESRTVRLELSEQLSGATVLADRDRLLQVFANLLSNAIKYSAPGNEARVEVAVKEKGRGVCVSVADQGPGIPEERLATLFVPFSQVHAPSAPRQEGTGLGLSIVKRLLEGMNGTITVESRVGFGTTFHVLLQRADQEEAQ